LEDPTHNLPAAEEHLRNALRVFREEAFVHYDDMEAGLLAMMQDIRQEIEEGEADAAEAG